MDRRGSRTLALVAAAVLACGCERGCSGGTAAPAGSGAPGLDLGGTDCSDGLVRCVEGRVEVSRLAHLPHPCGSLTEGRNACACPWDTVSVCASGCAAEGLVAIGDADAGATQLCRASRAALGTIARPPLPGDTALAAPRICSEVGTACIDGAVRKCEIPGRPEEVLAVCLHGCEPGIAVDHGERMIGDGAAAILCRRDHAERR